MSASRNVPSGAANLRAFHSAGLWLAVTWIPPSAPDRSTSNMSVGVATIPRSTTSHPTERSPDAADIDNIAPEVRESRPMIRVPSPAAALRDAPKAAASAQTSSGVNGSPTRPRNPDTLTTRPSGIFSGMSRGALSEERESHRLHAGSTLTLPPGRLWSPNTTEIAGEPSTEALWHGWRDRVYIPGDT